MAKEPATTPEQRARRRAKEYSDMRWHVASFVIINAFLWFIDIAGGDGVNWAYWPTIGWGIGVAFHVASYFIEDSGAGGRKYRQFLAEELEREASGSPDDL